MQQIRIGTKPETIVAIETLRRRIIADQEAGEKAGEIAIVLAHKRERAVGTEPQAASASAAVDDLGSRRAVGVFGTAGRNSVLVAFPARVVRHVGTDGAPVERWGCGTIVVMQAVLQRSGLRLYVNHMHACQTQSLFSDLILVFRVFFFD